jgi:hypothetical protein
MNAGTLILLFVLVALIGLVAYLATSQSELPTRIRRLFKSKIDDRGADEPSGMPPRPNARWGPDPDRTNEAREVERVTGVIRKGEPFTVTTSDPSFWGAGSFDIEGLVVGVAECETVDLGGNFQFRYLVVEAAGTSVNSLIIEGDAPTTSVVYIARALMPDDPVGEMRAGEVISRLQEERRRYRDSGANELAINLPPYEAATIIAARYEGKLALLEYEPGKGYLPVSAANPAGVRYADMTVRLDPSGWMVRLVEVGAYQFLLEMEPVRLNDLTVHHLA